MSETTKFVSVSDDNTSFDLDWKLRVLVGCNIDCYAKSRGIYVNPEQYNKAKQLLNI